MGFDFWKRVQDVVKDREDLRDQLDAMTRDRDFWKGHFNVMTAYEKMIDDQIKQIEELEKQIDIMRAELRYARDEHGC